MMFVNRSGMFLFLSAFTGLISVSGAGIAVKYACQGDSVQAFQNIEFNHCNATVYLHVNGNRNGNIAVWSFQNCIRNETIRPEYQSRLILDQNRTITITNFDHFDIAKYVVVISNMDTLPKIYEVRLFLMVAPSKACKPMIQQLGNILIASLNVEDCGKPAAIPYWEGYDGVSNTNKPILELIPGMEAKEYYACIKGVALTCVKNETSHDYCTKFEPEGRKCPPASLETCNANALIVVCLIQGILLFVAIFAIAVIFVRYRLRKENTNEEQANTLLENSKLLRKWKKYFGKLNWADINTLLNDDQRNGFKKYGDNLILQKKDTRRKNERQSYPKFHRLSKRIERLPQINIVTNLADMPTSTGNDEQNSNNKSKKITAGNMKSHGSESTDECIELL